MEGRKPNNFNEYVYGETGETAQIKFVRTKEWKLIRWGENAFHLYNLQNDPKETVNVIDNYSYAQVTNVLKDNLFTWSLKNVQMKSKFK